MVGRFGWDCSAKGIVCFPGDDDEEEDDDNADVDDVADEESSPTRVCA